MAVNFGGGGVTAVRVDNCETWLPELTKMLFQVFGQEAGSSEFESSCAGQGRLRMCNFFFAKNLKQRVNVVFGNV